MIVVDTSAIVALLANESSAATIATKLGQNHSVMAAATRVELGIVVESKFGAAGTLLLDELLERLSVEVVAVDSELAEHAIRAWRRFGRGNHAAALNYGDTFAYALAKQLGQPLLFVGDDFARTDVLIA